MEKSDLLNVWVISLTYTADAELSAVHAAGRSFLIVLKFFIENDLPANTKLSFSDYRSKSYRQKALLAHLATKCSWWAIVISQCPSSVMRRQQFVLKANSS